MVLFRNEKEMFSMNRNGISNTVAVLCLIVGAAAAFFIVKAIDNLRFELESMHATLKRIESRAPAVSAAAAPAAERHGSSAAGKIANAEFYAPSAVPGGRFVTATETDSKNLNDLLTNDSFVSQLNAYANDTLAERNFERTGEFEPKLAESWQVLDGGRRIRVKLRKGVLWHDFTDPVSKKQWNNVELTAADFKFYIDVIRNEKVDAAPMRTYLSDIRDVVILGDYEFDVVWAKPYFKSLETTLSLSPLPRHLYHAYPGPFDPEKFNSDHERNRILVGVGPYRFERWDKGSRILFSRWEKYYGAKYGILPPLKTLAFEIIQHPNSRLQAAMSRDIDETGLTADQWVHRTGGKEFAEPGGILRKVKYPSMSYNYIGFNLKNPVFADVKTRAALSHLVNTPRIIGEIYHGLARQATGPFFYDSDSCDRSIPPRDFSIDKAKKLLAEAGWKDIDGDGILERNGIKLRFTAIYPNVNTNYQRMLPMIKQDMAKAGVQMELLGLEWSVCVQRLEKKSFEACVMGWTGTLDPDPYQLWHSSQADLDSSSNMISFKNPEADALIEKIRVTLDPAERTKLYHRFHRLIYDEAPYIFLVSPYNLSAISSRYRNLRVFPLGYPTQILWTPAAQQLSVR